MLNFTLGAIFGGTVVMLLMALVNAAHNGDERGGDNH